MIRQMRSALRHAPGVARGAHAAALAGECEKEVVPTVITAGTRKAVGKDATFEVLAKRLADVGTWCVVVALAVELQAENALRVDLENYH